MGDRRGLQVEATCRIGRRARHVAKLVAHDQRAVWGDCHRLCVVCMGS
jgi:hypothetical protein